MLGRVGASKVREFSSSFFSGPCENARQCGLEGKVGPLCQPRLELSLKVVLWPTAIDLYGQGLPESGSLKFRHRHPTLGAVYLSERAAPSEDCVTPVMQSDRENKNTQLRKSHNVNVKHKLSVHLNLSLF